MKEIYRPEGWENPYLIPRPCVYNRVLSESEWGEIFKAEEPVVRKHEAFEAGANAMLEGLKKEGERVDIATYGGANCYFPLLLTIPARGVAVFIPEEAR